MKNTDSSAWQSDILARPSSVYTLVAGETTAIVAERLGLTLEQLRTYNQFRTFSKPFNKLTAGDEIDVPGDLKVKPAGEAPAAQEASTNPADDMETRLANGASQVAGILQSDDASDAVAGMARSAASNAANTAVSSWLGQFGTVQAQINIGEDFSLENSSLDWLVPIYDTPDNILFAQIGARNQDERNTINLGLGMRWFHEDWMYGLNGFYDADVTGGNRRLGVGVEAWRDYLQISANGYFRLTDWHQSLDHEDYDERPANGYDIRVNGWLPSYPQLGGKLMYEKYYGDDVALFGDNEEDRQKDPYAFTAGVSWTPFPLLTVGLDQRLGKGQKKDTSINVKFTWDPNKTWDSQVSPENVASMREISGSRYNLVERNYNIVLEYRKQELIKMRLSTPFIKDSEGTIHSVTSSVDSKYPLSKVSWNTAEFVAAGGVFRELNSTSVELTLPPYQSMTSMSNGAPDSKNDNVYILTATAEDAEGNVSPAQELIVEVTPPSLSFQGEMVVENDGVPANGTTPVRVKTTVVDGAGKPVAGQKVQMNAELADKSNLSAEVVTDVNGMAFWEFTSSVVGEAVVTATVGTQSQKAIVHFVASAPSELTSAHKADTKQIKNDGIDDAKVVLLLRDENKTPLPGQTIAFISSLEGTTVSEVVDRGDGTYSANVTGTTVGVTTITATVAGYDDFNEDPVQIEVVSAATQITEMTVAKDNASANGKDENSVRVVVTDANSQPVKDQEVSFTADNNAVIAPSGVTDANGVVTMPLTSQTAGVSQVKATLQDGNSKTVPVTFVQSSVVIYRGSSELAGNPVVDDTLSAVLMCEDTTCAEQPSTFQWQVESQPGSGAYNDIPGATGNQLTVTRDLQKRALRVSSQD
ncbi:ZirU family protein [Yokenella regensburgei]|uniref:ZirU family protein n=1 Tax=Yokenella regensburgei TaxID=158877 RepID=UPI0031DCB69F